MDQTTASRETREVPDESWRALPRFLVGSTLRGARELRSRAYAWNAALPPNAIPIRSGWESGHMLRWVLIGLLSAAPALAADPRIPLTADPVELPAGEFCEDFTVITVTDFNQYIIRSTTAQTARLRSRSPGAREPP